MKRFTEIAAHILFWVLTGWFFVKYSFIRPTIGVQRELLSVLMIMGIIYLNYFLLFPQLYKKGRQALYWIASLALVILITIIEVRIADPIVRKQLFIEEALLNQYINSLYFFIGLRQLGFLLFFLLLLFYREAKKVQRLEREKFMVEANYLKSRITPHFLYNVFNSIYADAIVQDKKLPDYILQLSKLLHYYVDESHQERVTVREEIAFYQQYTEMENKRFDNKVKLSFYADTFPERLLIPPLIFEPLIGNAFKYVPKQGDGFVEIHFENRNNQELFFSCVNNKWTQQPTQEKTTGIGLKNLKTRLDLLYPNQYQLQIDDQESQYSVTLVIPFLG